MLYFQSKTFAKNLCFQIRHFVTKSFVFKSRLIPSLLIYHTLRIWRTTGCSIQSIMTNNSLRVLSLLQLPFLYFLFVVFICDQAFLFVMLYNLQCNIFLKSERIQHSHWVRKFNKRQNVRNRSISIFKIVHYYHTPCKLGDGIDFQFVDALSPT